MAIPTTSNGVVSDTDVLDFAAASIATPRHEQGDSFILHAPLEVLARSALLTLAAPEGRAAIRERIRQIGVNYDGWGTSFDRQPSHSAALELEADQVLARALESGDAEAADDAISWLTQHLDTGELVRTLAGPVLTSLAAAAHGPILLYLLPRVAPRSQNAASMARSTIHELARSPERKLSWFNTDHHPQHGNAEVELTRRLAGPQSPEHPENTSIYPTMSITERTGLAVELLADIAPSLTVTEARRSLLRTAAHAMLQDDPGHAPYGWSHCLTMPQAALGIANASPDPGVAVAVAATYVLGFRASLGSITLDPDWTPDATKLELEELLDAPPGVAAAVAWHTAPTGRRDLWRYLATHAGAHEDAHVAKYTLACLDACRGDAEATHLYLAAATFLNAWWNERCNTTV